MDFPPICGDNPQALSSGLSPIQVDSQKLMVQLDWNPKAMKYMREMEEIPK